MSSHEFDDAFTHAASDCVTCEHCGRTYFTRHAEKYAELVEYARTHKIIGSEIYTELIDDSIAYGEIGGKIYVYQCSCKSVDRYEEWVWNHKEEIVSYLKARAKKESEESARNLQLADSI